MENNSTNIPSLVFDLIHESDFASLTVTQQQEVLQYMGRDEYDNLHHTIALISENMEPVPGRQVEIKAGLMERFDRKHRAPVPLASRSLFLWKAAAALLVSGLAISFYFNLRSNRNHTSLTIPVKHDTVYLSTIREQSPVKIYDTVYIMHEKATERSGRSAAPKDETTVREVAVIPQQELNIQSVKDVDAVPNIPRRNSIKDDSLIKHFNFVTL